MPVRAWWWTKACSSKSCARAPATQYPKARWASWSSPHSTHYPLIRFGTGDLSAVLPGACPTGRTNVRIKGWMGRADQTTKVRGMFVHPGQIATIAQRFPQVVRARLVVSGEMANDQMCLQVESTETAAGLAQQLSEAIREVTKLRGEVQILPPGSLPNDGRVIEDARSYR